MLFIAYRARNRAVREYKDRTASGDQGVLPVDAVNAIVTAAAAAEAFINEFADNVGLLRQNAGSWMPLPSSVLAAADAVLDEEFYRGRIVDKYFEASKALGQPLVRGELLFQDFDRLVELRNALMHIKAVRTNEEHGGEKIVDQLAARAIAIPKGKYALPWFDRLMSPEMGRWAFSTAHAMIRQIWDRVPVTTNDPFDMARRFYCDQARYSDESVV